MSVQSAESAIKHMENSDITEHSVTVQDFKLSYNNAKYVSVSLKRGQMKVADIQDFSKGPQYDSLWKHWHNLETMGGRRYNGHYIKDIVIWQTAIMKEI